MDPVANPFNPGAGTPPPELAGRDELLRVQIALPPGVPTSLGDDTIGVTASPLPTPLCDLLTD